MNNSLAVTTSIEYWTLETVRQTIETLARQGAFRSVVGDSVSRVKPEAVISRLNRRPSQDESRRGGERTNSLPGFICTYLGHTRPETGGENCSDDGVITILVSLLDDADDSDEGNIASYLSWMGLVRERLQQSPGSHRSPLEECPNSLGHVYQVHWRDSAAPDETDYGFKEVFRMSGVLSVYTRTLR